VTPFSNDEVLKAGKALLAFGTPVEQLKTDLRAVGDISSGTGKNFNELAVIYGKARVAGTLYAEDINQLTEAGIPVIQQFAKQLGVSESQVKKLGSEGKISFANLQQAFTDLSGEGGMFYNLMDSQSKTFAGQISTLKGQMQTTGVAIGEALLPVITPLVQKLGEFTTWVSANKEVIAKWVPIIAKVIVVIGSLIAIIRIWMGVQTMINFLLTANPIGLIIVAIGALIGLIAAVIVKWDEWGAALSFFMGPLGMIISLFQSIRRNWDMIKKSFSEGGIIEGFKAIGKTILDAVLYPIQKVLDAVAAFTGFEWAKNASQGIEDFRKAMGTAAELNVAAKPAFDPSMLDWLDTPGAGTGAKGYKTPVSGFAGVGGGEKASGGLGAGISEVKSSAPKTFNINIESLVKEFTVQLTNLQESKAAIKEEITKVLLEAVNDLQIQAGQ
jgi:tape measure domain-containing protein